MLLEINWSAPLNITYNIVGGILTIGAVELFRLLRRKWRRRSFKNIFGEGTESYKLVYAPLRLHPDVKALVPARPGGGEPFIFVRKDTIHATFSATKTTSDCEIRAASYVASALGKDGGRDSTFVDCESLESKLDVDFVSFGLTSNLKTLDVFNNEGNDLVILVPNPGFVARKGTGEPLLTEHRAGIEYGIILKIHPTQFLERTWIACAGMGETGTSGAAWFLARRWKELEKRAGGADRFFALIAVEQGKDESAVLVNFGTGATAH